MSGLEILGMFFCVLLGMGVFTIVMWVIGSTWRHGDEINILQKEIAQLKTKVFYEEIPKLNKKGKR